jgi:hypothetical protein
MSDSEGEDCYSQPMPRLQTGGNYNHWCQQFKNWCKAKGLSAALGSKGEPDPSLPTSEDNLSETVDVRKREKTAVKRNNLTINAFYLAFRDNDVLTQLVLNSQDADWPNGLASRVMFKLDTRFRPQDSVTPLDAEAALNADKMKKGESPMDFQDRIDAVGNQYPEHITASSKKIVVMKNSNSMYKHVIVDSLKDPNMDVESLINAMQYTFRTMKSLNLNDSSDEEEEQELALAQSTPGDSYLKNITCYHCGKKDTTFRIVLTVHPDLLAPALLVEELDTSHLIVGNWRQTPLNDQHGLPQPQPRRKKVLKMKTSSWLPMPSVVLNLVRISMAGR